MSKHQMVSDKLDLGSTPIHRVFWRYFLPLVLSVVIRSGLMVIEGVFIGQSVGPMGMATVGFSMPFLAFFSALAVMVGIGGSALMSARFGQGDSQGGRRVFEQSVLLITMAVLLLCVAGYGFLPDIISAMGADGELKEVAQEFLSLMLIFFVFHALVLVLTFFVINDTHPRLTLYAMAAGAAVNLGLDYFLLFELKMGMAGVAIAAIVAQWVMLAVLSTHFMRGKGQLVWSWAYLNPYRLRLDTVKLIVAIGSPAFLLELASSVTMLSFNYVLINQYSDLHLAAYGVCINLALVVVFFLGTLGQACQPVISFNYGAGNTMRIAQARNLGLRYSLAFGVVFTAFVLAGLPKILPLYAPDNPQLLALAEEAVFFYFLAVPPMAINLFCAAFFQAVQAPLRAGLISVLRTFALVLPGLFLWPVLFPQTGIWLLTTSAEWLTLPVSLGLLLAFFHSRKTGTSSVEAPAADLAQPHAEAGTIDLNK